MAGSNEELFKCDRNALITAWREYGKFMNDFLARNKGTANERNAEQGGFAKCPIENPFEWLYKHPDTALLPEFDPGNLVVDDKNRYGVILERRLGRAYNHMWAIECLLVDFRGTIGKVIVDADSVKPAKFPKELVEFAMGGNMGGIKDRVHEKVEEAFEEMSQDEIADEILNRAGKEK